MTSRARTRFVGCLLALACGWSAEPTAAQVPGLYKDGVLVEPMPELVPAADAPQELGKGRFQAPAGMPSGNAVERSAAARDCATVVDQLRLLLRTIAADGRAPNAGERRQFAALRDQVAVAGTRIEQALAGGLPAGAETDEVPAEASHRVMLAAAMRGEMLARQNQSIRQLRNSKGQYLAALDALAAGKGDAAAAMALTDALFPHAAEPLTTEPTVRPALLREAPRLTYDQAAALLPSQAAATGKAPANQGGGTSRGKSLRETKHERIPPVPKQPFADDPQPQPAPRDAPPGPENDPPAPPQESPPAPADLAETPEIQFTPEIMAKAIELGGSALPIYEFVRNQVVFQPYLGSRKGAAMTLRQRAGNDTDQAALLMALLRVSGIPCRYVRGTVDMTPAQAAAWLGVDEPTIAGNILTTAGLDGINMYYNSKLRAVRCTRVWVEAWLAYSNYRGIPNDTTGKTWVPLDPAWHGSVITQGADVLAAMGFNTQAFLADYISTFHAASPLEKLRSDIQTWLNANDPGKTVAEIERTFTIDQLAAGMLPGSVGGQPVAVSGRFSTLEDNKRYKVRFLLRNGGTTLIDQTYNLSDLIPRKVTIDYIGATPADQDIIDAHGGIYQTPPNLVNVKPRLKFDGTPVATATASIGMGRTHDSDMQFIQPAGDSNEQPWIYNTIIAGNTQAIAINSFFDVNGDLFVGSGSSALTFLEHQLHSTATDYLARVDRGIQQTCRLFRAVTTQDVSEAIVESSVAVTTSFGTPVTFEWTGLTVDADRRIIGPFAVDGNSSKKLPIMLLSGYDGSIMENRVFEDIYNQQAVSTIKILELSNDAGIPVYTFTSYPASGLNQPSAVVSAVNSALLEGRHITIPRDPITIGQWHGTGYISLKPASGAAGYIISGGINGSVSSNGGATVDVWPINLGCAPVGPVTGTITPSGFADGAILCPDNSQITYSVTLQYQCKDTNGNLVPKTFGPTSHTVPPTKLQILEGFGAGLYTISIPDSLVPPVHFTLLDVESLLPDKGVEVDDKDGDPNTKTFIVCYSTTAGDKVTVTAKPDPVVAEAQLPACWSLTGGTGSGKLQRTVDQTTPAEVKLTCQSGLRKKELTVRVIKVEFFKATPEGTGGNVWGYDTYDTPPKDNDDHVCVQNGGDTWVKVKITGATTGLTFKSDNTTVADVVDVPSPLPAEFNLKVRGGQVGEATIRVLPDGSTSPVCAMVKVNVYKLQQVAKWSIYRVTDSNSASTSPLTAITSAGMKSYANGILKQAVMKFIDAEVVDKDLHYDKNSNGALDWFYDGGTQTEFDEISGAGLTGDPKIAVVKNVNFAWRMNADAAAGATKIQMRGVSYLSGWLGDTYTLGSGATAENVVVTAVNGNELTLSAALANAHASGTVLTAAFGAGVGADPQIVEDGTDLQLTCLHETLHRTNVGNLLDLTSPTNVMHFSVGAGHDEIRHMPKPKKYEAGNEQQWPTIPRP